MILELLEDITRLLACGGIFVGSGIIRQNNDTVLSAMQKLRFEILETAAKEDWMAIVGRLPAESKEQRAWRKGHSV